MCVFVYVCVYVVNVCVWEIPSLQKCKVYVSEQEKMRKFIVLTSSSINALLVWSVVISLVYKSVCDDVNYCNIKKQEKMAQERKII